MLQIGVYIPPNYSLTSSSNYSLTSSYPSPPPVTNPLAIVGRKARLASGAVKLDLTKAWISKAVEGYIGREALKGGTEDDEERARRAAGLRNGREVHCWCSNETLGF